MAQFIVTTDVDRKILLDAGIPASAITDPQHAGDGAIYVGAAGQQAPAGATKWEGATRTQTAQLVNQNAAGVTYNGQFYLSSEWAASGIGASLGGSGSAMSPDQKSIYDIINDQLKQWGIDTLGDTVKKLLTQGLSQDAVMVQLENSDAFKQRFAGNQMRIQNGLAVLSPAQYVSTEAAYQQVLNQYGIGDTFATRDNYAKWIGNDVSATEVQSRAQEGWNLVQQSDPTARNLLKSWYGVGSSDILSTFLDPTQAQTTLDRKAFAANVGAAMQHSGLGTSQDLAEGLYGLGTQSQVIGGVQQAGLAFQRTSDLAQRYGAQYSEQDALNQYVRGDSAPALIQQQLAQKEQAQFARGAGFGSNGSGVSSGSF